MNILIDIGHPGHVHLFRPFAHAMIQKGHKILFTYRQKEFERELIESEGFNNICFGKHYKSKSGKIWGLFKFDLLMLRAAYKFKPDIFISHGSFYASHAAWLFGKSHISLEDTGNNEQVMLYKPFTKTILTSTAFHENYGTKHLRYPGYHELAYLHPAQFKPDAKIFKALELEKNQEYIIVRFVSWSASHDVGQKGLSLEAKRAIVSELTKSHKVFISSEGKLPVDLEKYKINILPEQMHHVLAFATLFIGEGATMASECAMLGTPAIYINTMEAGTIKEQEEQGLVFQFKNNNGILEKVIELLSIPDLKMEWQRRRNQMLQNKIDVSAFLVWFVENYPKSVEIVKKDKDYVDRFK